MDTHIYINKENIARSSTEAEYHPLHPCIDEETRVLFMGSFPPPMKRWAKDFFFFYPNFINDHWRIMSLIFFGDKDYLVDTANKTYRYEEVLRLVKEKHIGYYDTATAVKRLKDNASDKFLEVVEKTDIPSLIRRAPHLKTIAVTGEKAAQTLCNTFHLTTIPKTGHSLPLPKIFSTDNGSITLWRLPSSSRAYPMRLEDKAKYYREMLIHSGVQTL